ncbi:hypothetical protein D3C73_1184230 [compost metagenome]
MASETSSGRCNALDTVIGETPATLATSISVRLEGALVSLGSVAGFFAMNNSEDAAPVSGATKKAVGEGAKLIKGRLNIHATALYSKGLRVNQTSPTSTSAIRILNAAPVSVGFTQEDDGMTLVPAMNRFGWSWVRQSRSTTESFGLSPMMVVPMMC